jgi:hypothetical protein
MCVNNLTISHIVKLIVWVVTIEYTKQIMYKYLINLIQLFVMD